MAERTYSQPEKLYCPKCGVHTEQAPLVDAYGTQCKVCGTLVAALDRLAAEANRFYAPDGTEGILVENTPEKAVFYVPEGHHRGYYVYDKATGFGAIRNT